MGAAVGDDATNFINALTNGIVKVPFSEPTAGELKVLKDASRVYHPQRTYVRAVQVGHCMERAIQLRTHQDASRLGKD